MAQCTSLPDEAIIRIMRAVMVSSHLSLDEHPVGYADALNFAQCNSFCYAMFKQTLDFFDLFRSESTASQLFAFPIAPLTPLS